MVVRTVVYHHHFRKKKLCAKLFEPPADTDQVSMMRVEYLGVDECKRISKERIEDVEHKKIYKGFATIGARSIRAVGANIEDSSEQYWGHADLRIGFTRKRGDPLQTPEEQLAYENRLNALFNEILYFEDPDPDTPGWKGPQLVLRSES